MSPIFLVFAGVFLAALAVRDTYELRKKAGRVDTRDGRVFAFLLASMCLLWVSWFGMGVVDPVRLDLPAAVRGIGLAGVLAGSGLAVVGVWQLKGVENIDHLVMTGIFSRIRHPIYIGFLLWIAGWILFEGAVLSLVPGVIGLLSIAWWRHLEEADLVARFGDYYSEYRLRTWF